MKTFLETCERSFGCSGPASEHVSRIFKQEMRGTCLQRLRRRARASRQLAGGALIVEVLSSPCPPPSRRRLVAQAFRRGLNRGRGLANLMQQTSFSAQVNQISIHLSCYKQKLRKRTSLT